jgi:hypothetical protein
MLCSSSISISDITVADSGAYWNIEALCIKAVGAYSLELGKLKANIYILIPIKGSVQIYSVTHPHKQLKRLHLQQLKQLHL